MLEHQKVAVQPTYQKMIALVPAHHPKDICQREQFVQDVYHQLIRDDISALVLTGMQGIGKSTLAALVWEYAEKQRQAGKGPFKDEALWLAIKPTVTLADLLGTLCVLLGRPALSHNTLSEQNLLLELSNLLQNDDTPRLIVLDQLDGWLNIQTGEVLAEQAHVAKWLDRVNSYPYRSRLIFTAPLWPQWSRINRQACMHEVSVSGLTTDEGINLLRLWGVQGSNTELMQAAEHCHGHPQALALLEQLLREHGVKLSTLLYDPEYLQLWLENVEQNLFDHIYIHQLEASHHDLLFALTIYREAIPIGGMQSLTAIMNSPAKKQLPALLNTLQARGLLLAHVSDERRYELHPLIAGFVRRLFAEEPPGTDNNGDTLRAAHNDAARYYLSLFKRLDQFREERQSIQDLHDLVEAVWHYCQAKQWQDAYTLIVQEHIFTDLHRWGHNTVLLELYKELLHWHPGNEQEANINNDLGEIYTTLGQKEQAKPCFERAAALFRQSGAHAGEAVALDNLGVIYRSYAQLERALTCYREALRICEESSEEIPEKGAILHNIGKAYQNLGQKEEAPDAKNEHYAQALKYYTQALAIHRTTKNRDEEGKTLNNIGEVYSNLEQNESAYQYYQQALDLFLELGERRNEGITRNNLGVYYRQIGAYKDAFAYYSQALMIYQEIGDRWEEINVLRNLGYLLALTLRYDVALACFWLVREIADALHTTSDDEAVPRWIRISLDDKRFTQLWSQAETNAAQILEQAMRMEPAKEKKKSNSEPPSQYATPKLGDNELLTKKGNTSAQPYSQSPAFEKGSVGPMIKVLFLAANPLDTDHLAQDKEFRTITESIRASRFRDSFRLETAQAVRIDDLTRELNYHQPHIAHFSSHGSKTGDLQLYGKGDSSLSEPISAEQLKDFFHAWRGNIRLVILNACYSAIQAKLIAEEIDCVIGMNSEIYDRHAIDFIDALYDAIGSGCSLATAFQQSVTKMKITGPADEAWSTPQIYVRSGVNAAQIRLVQITQAAPRPQLQTEGNSQPQSSDEHKPISIYCSYAKEDKKYYTSLKKQSRIMEEQGLIKIWGYQDLQGGNPTKETLLQQLRAARIVLLFVSPDFFGPERQPELNLAQELQQQQETRVIPIIIRKTSGWESTPFSNFYSLPRDKAAVTSWPDRDEAFYYIIQDIQKVVETLHRAALEGRT